MAEFADSGEKAGAQHLSYSVLAPLVNRTEALWRGRHRLSCEQAITVARVSGERLASSNGTTSGLLSAALDRAVEDTVALWRRHHVTREQSAEIGEIACARLERHGAVPASRPPESAETATPNADRPPHASARKKHCQGMTVYGTRCGRPAVGNSDYCRWCLPRNRTV